ncbi:MAG: transcriptional regulator [Gammaproteobacteria bacterium]
MKTVKVGIMPLEQFRQRTIAIAKGEYKPSKDEPKIWFNSIKSLAHVLSEENQQLLKIIADAKPQSIKELELLTGRKANNLLRTLRTMENYGLVELLEGQQGRGRAALIPKALYEAAHIEIEFGHAA